MTAPEAIRSLVGQSHWQRSELDTVDHADIKTPPLLQIAGQEHRFLGALHSSGLVTGLTHGFYRYPARMLPELAREIIEQYSAPDETVLDPFMGGGTTVVEALAAGRRTIGMDINSLATFLAESKTTPLSIQDEDRIRQWASSLTFTDGILYSPCPGGDPLVRNLPAPLCRAFGRLLQEAVRLPRPRQQRFARCCLLRLGQWCIDGKASIPDPNTLAEKLLAYVEEMLAGLREFVARARGYGVAKNLLTGRRLLLLRSVVGAEQDKRLRAYLGKPSLVLTSPPYPGIHVLYHRWQVAGRRETPAPYWFIGARDGQGASYYTLGGRSPVGIEAYFQNITLAYQAVRAIVRPSAMVVQLVAFADADSQLPAFLHAMERAGYKEVLPAGITRAELWRAVPHRQWYNRVGADPVARQELLLFHRRC